MTGAILRRYAVTGMHCTSCGISIDWELEDLDGVTEANTSYAESCTKVVFDPERVTEADILAAIARAGFEARPEPA